MNMRCRSPEQHRRKGTTNSHSGNSTSTSLCTTSSPSLSSVCRRGGEGEGEGEGEKGKGPCGSLCCGYPSPLRPCGSPRSWLGGGGGHTMGGGPATRRHGTIYALLGPCPGRDPPDLNRLSGCAGCCLCCCCRCSWVDEMQGLRMTLSSPFGDVSFVPGRRRGRRGA